MGITSQETRDTVPLYPTSGDLAFNTRRAQYFTPGKGSTFQPNISQRFRDDGGSGLGFAA